MEKRPCIYALAPYITLSERLRILSPSVWRLGCLDHRGPTTKLHQPE